MNENQFERFPPQPFDLQHEEAQARETTKYIAIDSKGEMVGLTRDKHLASSLKQLHAFVMTRFSELTPEEIDLLSSDHLEHVFKENRGIGENVTRARNGILGMLSTAKKHISNKFNSMIEAIVNLCKNDKTLIREIQIRVARERIKCKSIAKNFNLGLQQYGLRQQLEKIILLKNRLEHAEKNLDSLINFLSPEQTDKLAKDIEAIENELLKQQRMIKHKEMRKKINDLLKQIRISKNDSSILQEAKNKLQAEHKIFIDIMQSSLHIQFDPKAEVNLFFTEEKKSSKLLKINTNFSDRSMEPANGYYLRAPQDSSVEKSIQPYLKDLSLTHTPLVSSFEQRSFQQYNGAIESQPGE